MGYIAKTCTIVTAVCALLPAAANAENDWIHLYPFDWQVELEYEGRNEQRGGFGSTQDSRYTQKLQVRQTGYSIAPQIFDFSITLTPTFMQGQQDSFLRTTQSDSTFLDYNVDLAVLRGSTLPFDLGVGASRNTGTISNSLGSRERFTQEHRSLNLGIKLPAFPMQLIYKERLQDHTSQSRLTSTTRRRDEFQQSVKWRGQSSKMQVEVEKRWFDDRISDNDYELLQQSITHSLAWGKNSNLRTRQEYITREGANPFSRFSVSEGLRLQHLENLQSALEYNYTSIEQNTDTEVQFGQYVLNYRPSKTSSMVITARGRNSELETGSELEFGGSMGIRYAKDVFLGGKLNFNLSTSSLQTDRQSNGSTFETVDASHTVPVTLIVLLETRAIEATSIIVTDASAAQVFLEGVDYIVRALSGDRTELQILTSGLIAAGDTILVSYSAAAQPSAEFNEGIVQGGISLNFDWVELYHQSQAAKSTLQSGSFGEGNNDRIEQTTGVRLKRSGKWFEATAAAETYFQEAGDFANRSDSYSESVHVQLSAQTHLFLSAGQIFFESDGQEINLNQWDVNLEWLPGFGLSVKPFVNGWDRQEATGNFEERLRAGLNLTWKFRKFDLDFDASHSELVTQNTDQTEDRIGVRIVRRSR